MKRAQKLTAVAPMIVLALAACSAGETRESPGEYAAATNNEMQQAVQPLAPHPGHVSAGGKPPPASVMQNPFKGDTMSVKTGQQLFTSMNCEWCHNIFTPGPALLDGRFKYGGLDAEIFETIYGGRPGGMPAYGNLPRETIWHLVNYIQANQPKQDMSTVSW